MDDTSKHAKFQVDGFFTFGDMTSQKFPFQNGTSHRDSIFTSWIQAKFDKNHFLCLETPFLAQSYTPFCISIVFKQKQKFHRFNFSRRLISKTTAATPLVNRFC